MKFLWCSVHVPTEEQIKELTNAGDIYYLKDIDPELQDKINNCPKDKLELSKMADDLGEYTRYYLIVQPGGSPAFQFMLGHCLSYDVSWDRVLYAHSERVSVDKAQPDGSIIKTSVFKHIKFI